MPQDWFADNAPGKVQAPPSGGDWFAANAPGVASSATPQQARAQLVQAMAQQAIPRFKGANIAGAQPSRLGQAYGDISNELGTYKDIGANLIGGAVLAAKAAANPAAAAGEVGSSIAANIDPNAPKTSVAAQLLAVNKPKIEQAIAENDPAGFSRQVAAPIGTVLAGGELARASGVDTGATVSDVIENRTPGSMRAAAGKKFQAVAAAVGDSPVDFQNSGNVALEVKDMASRGAKMPKVINDFIKRVTDPEKGPLTYNEARDFYSNGTRLSLNEMNQLTPPMQRQMGRFLDALGKDINDTAQRGGVGDQYSGAMSQYRNAARYSNALKQGAKAGAALTGTAVGGSALRYLLTQR